MVAKPGNSRWTCSPWLCRIWRPVQWSCQSPTTLWFFRSLWVPCTGHEEELGEAPPILARFGGPVLWQKVFSKGLAKNLCISNTIAYLDMGNIFSHSSKAVCWTFPWSEPFQNCLNHLFKWNLPKLFDQQPFHLRMPGLRTVCSRDEDGRCHVPEKDHPRSPKNQEEKRYRASGPSYGPVCFINHSMPPMPD